MSLPAAFGIRRLLDANQRYFASGLPVFYRTEGFNVENTLAGEMGFSVPAVSGANGGTNDALISPPPDMKPMNLIQIQAAVAAGSQLRIGAYQITVSHTWVEAVQKAKGFDDPTKVFTDDSVVGLMSSGRLFEIKSYVPGELYGNIIKWTLLCNASELK
ncbi:MAG: hypothetical protein ACRYGG_21685 [Janthinobacterium lividum]